MPTTGTSRRSAITRCFLFNDDGDCLAATLRPGNVSSADDWDELLVPEIERQQAQGKRVAFRADAAFARPVIYEALEATRRPVRDPDTREQELGARGRRHAVSSGGTARPHAIGPVHEFPLSGGQLDHAPTGRGKKASTMSASCSRASASSSRISRVRIVPSCGFTRSAGRRSNGSRKASRPRIGRACRVIGSGRTRSACH